MKYSIALLLLCACTMPLFAQIKGAKDPAWSPNEKMLAFASDVEGSYDIYTMNTDGTNRQRLTSTEGDELWPSWMGDSVVVFEGQGKAKGNPEIYFLRLADKTILKLTNDAGSDATPNVGRLTSRILFEANRSIDKLPDVWVMEKDGGNQQQLTKGAKGYGQAVWSPDEKRIAFTGKFTEKHTEIQLMDADGSKTLGVSEFNAMSQHPNWSSDGNRLVFSSNASRVFSLYTFDLTAGKTLQVAFTRNANLYRPSFSADGNSILFCEEKNKKWQVRVLDLKSGISRTIVDR